MERIKTMKCRQIKKLLPLYISADLDAPQLQEIDNHLAECLACNREFQSFNQSLDFIKQLLPQR